MSKKIIEEMMETTDRVGQIVQQTVVVDIDPDTADWLYGFNHVNRVIRQHVVETYARDMREGRWNFTSDTIKFDEDGNLIDGQHRLRAIMLSGVTGRIAIAVGLAREVQLVIDGGSKRTAADALNFAGLLADSKYANRIAAAARSAWNIEKNSTVSRTTPPSTAELIEWIEKNHAIQDAVFAVDGLSKTIALPPAFTAVAYFFGMKQIPQETIKFFNDLRTNVGLAETSPANLLRLRISAQNNSDTYLEKFWLMLRALNMVRYGYIHTRILLPTTSGDMSAKIMYQVRELTRTLTEDE
jgi:hypothetical protein